VEVVASLSQGRTTAAQGGLFTYKSVPVIFEPPCTLQCSFGLIPYIPRDSWCNKCVSGLGLKPVLRTLGRRMEVLKRTWKAPYVCN